MCFNTHMNLRIPYANVKNTIPRITSIVNETHFNRGRLENTGTIIAAPNQPAAKFTNKSEIRSRSNGSIYFTLSKI